MTIKQKAREIAESLTLKQAQILTRPEGRYTDDAGDVLRLLDTGVLGTFVTPLGAQVRELIEEQKP